MQHDAIMKVHSKAAVPSFSVTHCFLSFSWPWDSNKIPRGGTCENFDRDARVIFLGLKFTKMSFFWVSLSWRHFLGLTKLPSFFWVH